MNMFSKSKTASKLLENNPILQYYEVGRLYGNGGPEGVWKIYEAVSKADGRVSFLHHGCAIFSVRQSVWCKYAWYKHFLQLKLKFNWACFTFVIFCVWKVTRQVYNLFQDLWQVPLIILLMAPLIVQNTLITSLLFLEGKQAFLVQGGSHKMPQNKRLLPPPPNVCLNIPFSTQNILFGLKE